MDNKKSTTKSPSSHGSDRPAQTDTSSTTYVPNATDAPPSSNLTFFNGVQAGVPIALGYLPIAIAFGLLANASGVPVYVTLMMSFLIFAGASQFVGVNLLALGVSFSEIILTTFILNLRHFLMSASISRRIEGGTAKHWLAVLAFGITDESFTVASMRPEAKLSSQFMLGLNLTGFSAWNIGTWAGVFLGAALPASVQSAMGIALYVMFIGLLVPSMRQSLPVLVIACASAVVHSILHWLPVFDGLSTGWNIVIATIIAALVGAIIFPKGADA